MSEELLIQHCSPTLAGIKTGNLFSCFFDDPNELKNCVRSWNRQLAPKGLRILPMKFDKGRALIYVYRPSRLSADLNRDTAEGLLSELGYSCKSPEHCVCELMKRLRSSECFPHEIGLFLGYPPVDVYGFMRCNAKNSKCVGTWKVYGDEKKAKRQFESFKKCTDVYKRAYERHNSFDKLVVSAK